MHIYTRYNAAALLLMSFVKQRLVALSHGIVVQQHRTWYQRGPSSSGLPDRAVCGYCCTGTATACTASLLCARVVFALRVQQYTTAVLVACRGLQQ